MIRIRTPATTANMGSGFDCLGAALELYNEVLVEPSSSGREVIWLRPQDRLPCEDNKVIQALEAVFDHCSFACPGYRITMGCCEIPLSRGLGSSAAAITAGVLAANALMGSPLDTPAMLDLAAGIEGHPDNVIPCFLGGMQVSVSAPDGVIAQAVPVPDGLRFAALIPEFTLSTAAARAVLPPSYPAADVRFNIARAAYLVAAMAAGGSQAWGIALEDKVHQPYRLPLIPGADKVWSHCLAAGAAGVFLSGAGPTLMAVLAADFSGFADTIRPLLTQAELHWNLRELKLCRSGAELEVC